MIIIVIIFEKSFDLEQLHYWCFSSK